MTKALPTFSEGMSIAAVRALFGLDKGTLPVLPYARRPRCYNCKRGVVGHSYHHQANGVICHACLYGVPRAADQSGKPGRLRIRHRVYNHNPPHPCATAGCRNQVAEPRATHCRNCAAKLRNAKRKKHGLNPPTENGIIPHNG